MGLCAMAEELNGKAKAPPAEMAFHLSELLLPLKATLQGENVMCRGVSTDTRKLKAGDLFVAIKGERYDGHDYLDAARAAGAVAALVNEDVGGAECGRLSCLRVADTRIGLGQLAAWWRDQFSIPVIGVTGSNGKTTVKEMIGVILAQRGNPLVTAGNLNNDIGVPLTLLRLRAEHSHAVIEMGANHGGEIDYLARIARPDVALVNNAAPAHLEGFGDLDGVARAKGEMYAALSPTAWAIINADDHYAAYWSGLLSDQRRLRFGLCEDADVSASDVEVGAPETRFQLRIGDRACEVQLQVPGAHNVMNALAAAALATALDLPLEQIRAGLQEFRPVSGRLTPNALAGGGWLIDDTYNANPASVLAAVAVLAARPGQRILVLGDMAELGCDAERQHAEVGTAARRAGIDLLFTVGLYAGAAGDAFGEGAVHFPEHHSLINALREYIDADTTVLVKGSRSARMERVVTALLDKANLR